MNPSTLEAKTAPDTTEIEDWLCRQMAKKLKLQALEPQTPFATLSLDSLVTMQLLDKLERWLGQTLPATVFYDYPNVRAMAVAIAKGNLAESVEYQAVDEGWY